MKFYKSRIVEKSCRDPGLFRTHAGASSPYIWTRDLQIFSLTLSQLSYLGSHANIKNNVK